MTSHLVFKNPVIEDLTSQGLKVSYSVNADLYGYGD